MIKDQRRTTICQSYLPCDVQLLTPRIRNSRFTRQSRSVKCHVFILKNELGPKIIKACIKYRDRVTLTSLGDNSAWFTLVCNESLKRK